MHKETFDHAIVLLDVIESKPMDTRMVTVSASEMSKGIAATGHIAAGVGLLAPVAANDTEEGRARNRRVELVKR
jgi:OOP family OmpA-OmpF porin